jgi:phosphopantothenoylcysteine decarboxylase
MKVLVGITGSVAAKLTSKIQQALIDKGHEVKTVFTKSALYFHDGKSLFDEYDDDEWSYYKNENKVLHIDLTKWADRFVVAPCTANTMAKIANGFCDNLVTSCVRAWDLNKRLYIAPAMNCKMWENLVTQGHRKSLVNRGYFIHDPVEKELFCGDLGIGVMAPIEDLLKYY